YLAQGVPVTLPLRRNRLRTVHLSERFFLFDGDVFSSHRWADSWWRGPSESFVSVYHARLGDLGSLGSFQLPGRYSKSCVSICFPVVRFAGLVRSAKGRCRR